MSEFTERRLEQELRKLSDEELLWALKDAMEEPKTKIKIKNQRHRNEKIEI